jgi:hypothetical protein
MSRKPEAPKLNRAAVILSNMTGKARESCITVRASLELETKG